MDPVGSLSDVDVIDNEDDVVVPEIRCPLDQAQIQVFKLRMSTVHRAGPWDIQPYIHAVETLHEILDDAVADV